MNQDQRDRIKAVAKSLEVLNGELYDIHYNNEDDPTEDEVKVLMAIQDDINDHVSELGHIAVVYPEPDHLVLEIACDTDEGEEFVAWLNQSGHDATLGKTTSNFIHGKDTSLDAELSAIMNQLWNQYCDESLLGWEE